MGVHIKKKIREPVNSGGLEIQASKKKAKHVEQAEIQVSS